MSGYKNVRILERKYGAHSRFHFFETMSQWMELNHFPMPYEAGEPVNRCDIYRAQWEPERRGETIQGWVMPIVNDVHPSLNGQIRHFYFVKMEDGRYVIQHFVGDCLNRLEFCDNSQWTAGRHFFHPVESINNQVTLAHIYFRGTYCNTVLRVLARALGERITCTIDRPENDLTHDVPRLWGIVRPENEYLFLKSSYSYALTQSGTMLDMAPMSWHFKHGRDGKCVRQLSVFKAGRYVYAGIYDTAADRFLELHSISTNLEYFAVRRRFLEREERLDFYALPKVWKYAEWVEARNALGFDFGQWYFGANVKTTKALTFQYSHRLADLYAMLKYMADRRNNH